MNSSNTIRSAIILFIVLISAVWLGVSIVTQQSETIIKIAGGGLLLTGALLGQRVWLLYIFFVALGIPIIRGIGTAEIGQMMLIGFCALQFLMRRIRLHWKFDEMDFWRLVIVIVVAQVYFRNPVGLNVFGAGAVGARPYFDAGLGIAAGFILSKLAVPENEIRWAMYLSIVGSILSVPLGILRGTGLSGGGTNMNQVGEGFEGEAAGRNVVLRRPAILIAQVVSSRISPLKACFHPIWAPLIILSIAFAALTGYRNVVASVGLLYLAGIAYRGGFFAFIASLILGGLAIGMLALVNVAYPLPAKLQRALSPFPGTWEERYVNAAEQSTEWRVEMWKDALFTDNWIEDKIFGDGLGLTRVELQRLQALEEKGNYTAVSGLTVQQEAMMITGNYHSGPVQTVRAVGYVGLFFLILAMVRLSVHAHRQIQRCKGTEWHVISLFFFLPIVIYPIFFIFVFGEFGSGIRFLFLSSGLLSLVKYNLPIPPWQKRTSALNTMRNHRSAPEPKPA